MKRIHTFTLLILNKFPMKKFLILLLLSLSASSYVNSQTVGFSCNKDTIFDLQSIVFYNQSSGFPASTSFLWTVNGAFYFANSQYLFSKTTLDNDSVFGFMNANGADSLIIMLSALDSTGQPIQGFSVTQTFQVYGPLMVPPIWTIDSCHQAMNICTNLICNGDFEWSSGFVTGINQIHCAQPWSNPGNATTPDYFTAFSSNPLVPLNACGYQHSMNSAGGDSSYAGILTIWLNNYREYIQTPLNMTLLAGQKYKAELFVSMANESHLSSNDIQMFFSPDSFINLPDSFIIVNDPRVIDFTGQNNVTDTMNWVQLTAEFITDSTNLDWLIIGNFLPLTSVNTNIANPTAYFPYSAYYYIDNVSLVPLPPEIIMPSDTIFYCSYDSITIKPTITGAASYIWSTGATIDSIRVKPSVTTSYLITATDFHGCNISVDSITVYIPDSIIYPNVWVNNDTLCIEADSAILSVQGTGAVAYLWSTGDTTQSITIAPMLTTSYTVTITGNMSPCNDTILTATVFVGLSPDMPQLSGSSYNCDTLMSFFITNYDTSYSYYLAGSDQVYSQIYSPVIVIDMLAKQKLGLQDTFYIKVKENYCNQEASITVILQACCIAFDTNMVVFNKDTLSNLSQWYNANTGFVEFISTTISINDTLVLNANTLFDHCEVFLAVRYD